MFVLSILRFGSSEVAKSRNAPENAVTKVGLLNAGGPKLFGELGKYDYE